MNKIPKYICFDLDGTLADLYGVDGWLPDLEAQNPRPYIEAEPLWDMVALMETLNALRELGTMVVVISWLAQNSTPTYDELVRQAKREWLAEQGFEYDFIHLVQYGTTKANTIRKYVAEDETAVLVDDNARVRNGWSLGETIDPTTENIIDVLKALIG